MYNLLRVNNFDFQTILDYVRASWAKMDKMAEICEKVKITVRVTDMVITEGWVLIKSGILGATALVFHYNVQFSPILL